ncbi:hypothetical protein L584_02120 [Pantoea agglomerans Tx10]|nr:hypothetical protein L584_02120 [Pantoea agglomerans Tx10]KDA95129.1 hypothetical protein T296_07320 [Pantoea agglomerans Eh318]
MVNQAIQLQLVMMDTGKKTRIATLLAVMAMALITVGQKVLAGTLIFTKG